MPAPGGDKEQRGRVLVIGGSRRVPGGALLAAIAALRVGAGKLQIGTAEDVATQMALAMPEALVLGLPVDGQGEIARGNQALDHALAGCDAVLLGAGMGASVASAALVRRAIGKAGGTLVLDAGALSSKLRAPEGAPFVLTPHEGEMARLAGQRKSTVQQQPQQLALAFAQRTGSVLVLKGATTFVASPEGQLWVHRASCPGLGTSGSGDVLAGLIAGVAARCGDALQAALWGVRLHALGGQAAARGRGTLGFLAREIADGVPAALDRLR